MNGSQEPAQPPQQSTSPAVPAAERGPGAEAGGTAGFGGPSGEAGGTTAFGGSSGEAGGTTAFGGPVGAGSGGGFGGPAGGGEGAGFGLAHPFGGEAPAGPAPGFVPRWAAQRSVRRPWKRTAVVTVASALCVLVLGGPLGLLWAWLAPGVPVIDTGRNGVVVNDPSPEEYIAADGWFTLLGLGFGVLVAVAGWLVLRRDRGPFLLVGVVAGTLGAGWLVAPWIGEMIGRDDYTRWQQTAAAGATYLAPPEVHSLGPMLVPAFVAAIVLTLLAGWSNDPDLDEPGALPGYGPNAAAGAGYGPNTGATGPRPEPGLGPNAEAGYHDPGWPPRG